MFALALIFGIYSYSIFIFGIVGALHKSLVLVFTVVFVSLVLKYFRFNINNAIIILKNKIRDLDKFSRILLSLITFQAIVNIIGLLGPELSFDALWYHLTLPRIFLQEHKIFHIPGSLLYYSDLPKLGETLYIGALSFGNEIFAKFIHFIFGILCLVVIFKIAVKFVDKKLALLACLVFYSNLIVGWESITAYIDLIRTFFEVTAFLAFLEWVEKKDKKLLYESAIILGLAISTKLIAVGSLIVFAVLIFYHFRANKIQSIVTPLKFSLVSLLVVSPWFVYSFVNTGNPIYPILTSVYPVTVTEALLNPFNFLNSIINLFLNSPDPISPIYLIIFPVTFLIYKKEGFSKVKYLILYAGVSLIVWYITPQTGGGRFFLPYLPIFSVISVYLIKQYRQLFNFFVGIVVLIAILSIGYRGFANSKFVPLVLGLESKEEFMSKNLNFSYGDFYDIDGFFNSKIKASDKVLLYGFHNLYYVKFPFVDSSFVKKGDLFNYVAVQDQELPDRFKFLDLIYSNNKTNVNVYSFGGEWWRY